MLGTFLQRAHGLPRAVALDPSVGRVRGAGVDPCDLKRSAVDPGTVAVPVRQECGAAAGYLVELLLGRDPARKGLHRPAAAGDPFRVRMRGGISGNHVGVFGRGLDLREVAAAHPVACEDGMYMRVNEPRQQGPAAQVDRLSSAETSGPAGATGRAARLDRSDLSVADADHGAGGHEPGTIEDRSVAEHELGIRPHPDLLYQGVYCG